MRIAEIIERLGRTVFEAPFTMSPATRDSPEVAGIRIAVLDEVKKKVQRAGGKALFPYNLVRIRIHAGGSDAAVLARDFFCKFLDEEVRKSLSKDACRFPDDLRVEIRVTRSEPSDDGWLLIETVAVDPLAAPAESDSSHRIAKLTVVSGAANKSEFMLQKARTNIGRLAACDGDIP